MAEWKYKRLDELGNVSRGKSKHRPRDDSRLFGGRYPFIQTAEVKEANFYITKYSQTYSDFGLAQSKLWHPGTLCITIAANIADTAILAIDACFPDSVMGFVPFEGVADVRFVKYSFDILQREFKQISQGTAQDNLSWKKLSTIKFNVPSYVEQVKIANILSAYDELIENNQKQIKLLEEAAQRLYKEWFVDLHFPGYEDTKIVDGLPEGWERISVGDILGKVHRTEQIVASDYQKKGKIPIIDQSRNFIAGYTDNDNAIIDLGHPAIVFGDHTRVLKLIQFPFAKGADGTQLIVSSYKKMPERLFYCSLINVDLSNYHYARHFKYLKAEKIVVPTEKTANEAEAYLEPLFKKVQKCRDIINAAVQSRNCLLPRLMSGEIEV